MKSILWFGLLALVGCTGKLVEKGAEDNDGGSPVIEHDMSAPGDAAVVSTACVPPSPLKGGSFTAVEAIVSKANMAYTAPQLGCVGSNCHASTTSPGAGGALNLVISSDAAANYTALVNAGKQGGDSGVNSSGLMPTSVMNSELWRIVNGMDTHIGGAFNNTSADSASTITTFNNWMLDCFPGMP